MGVREFEDLFQIGGYKVPGKAISTMRPEIYFHKGKKLGLPGSSAPSHFWVKEGAGYHSSDIGNLARCSLFIPTAPKFCCCSLRNWSHCPQLFPQLPYVTSGHQQQSSGLLSSLAIIWLMCSAHSFPLMIYVNGGGEMELIHGFLGLP